MKINGADFFWISLQLMLIYLKITGQVGWSWFFIFFPALAYIGMMVAGAIIMIYYMKKYGFRL